MCSVNLKKEKKSLLTAEKILILSKRDIYYQKFDTNYRKKFEDFQLKIFILENYFLSFMQSAVNYGLFLKFDLPCNETL